MNDLRDLRAAVANIRAGKAKGRGFTSIGFRSTRG